MTTFGMSPYCYIKVPAKAISISVWKRGSQHSEAVPQVLRSFSLPLRGLFGTLVPKSFPPLKLEKNCSFQISIPSLIRDRIRKSPAFEVKAAAAHFKRTANIGKWRTTFCCFGINKVFRYSHSWVLLLSLKLTFGLWTINK